MTNYVIDASNGIQKEGSDYKTYYYRFSDRQLDELKKSEMIEIRFPAEKKEQDLT